MSIKKKEGYRKGVGPSREEAARLLVLPSPTLSGAFCKLVEFHLPPLCARRGMRGGGEKGGGPSREEGARLLVAVGYHLQKPFVN